MSKEYDVRVEVTPTTHPRVNLYRERSDDPLWLVPSNPRMRPRIVREAFRRKGEIVISTRSLNSSAQCLFSKSEVTPESWEKIITPAVQKKLRVRKLKQRTGYRLGRREQPTLVKVGKSYKYFSSRLPRTHVIEFCRAVLEDEGYRVTP